MRAISLFSGCGGFEIGFDRTGIETILQAESDPWCLSVLIRRWPDVERVTDVRDVGVGDDGRGLVEGVRWSESSRAARWHGERIDLVYGGFPCQDVSVAGKRAGLSGERSGLWHEFRRVLRQLRPRWTVIENVPGLLSSHSGRDFATILLGLEELGYGWAYRVLDARWFGVPQRRRRVFVVGCLGDARRAAQVLAVCESCGGHPAPRRETGQAVAFTLAGGSPDTSRRIGNAWNTTYLAASLSAGGHPGSNMPGRHKEDDVNLVVQPEARALMARASGYRMDFETENFVVAGALRASDGHHGHSSPRGDGSDTLIAFDYLSTGTKRSDIVRRGDYSGSLGAQRTHEAIASQMGVRRLTPLECERLMGWPDEWTRWTADGREIPDSHRYRMCGNGVVATVAEWLGHRLVRANAFVERVA